VAQKPDLGLRVFIIEVSIIIHTHTQPTGLPNRRDHLFKWSNDVLQKSMDSCVREDCGEELLARVQK
jgi:hypothetical protein